MAAMWRKWKRIPWEWRWTIVVTSVIAGFYWFENTRGAIAWERFQDEIRKNGGVIYPEEFVIEPVPDEENFAMYPEVARWNDRAFKIEFPPGFDRITWQPDWETGNRVHTAPYFPEKNYSEPEACEIYLSLTKEIEPHIDFLREAAAARPRNLWILQDKAGGPYPYFPNLFWCLLINKTQAIAMTNLEKNEEALGMVFFFLDLGRLYLIEPRSLWMPVQVGSMLGGSSIQPVWQNLEAKNWNESQLEVLSQKLRNIIDACDSERIGQRFRAESFASLRKLYSLQGRLELAEIPYFDVLLDESWINFPDQIPFSEDFEYWTARMIFYAAPKGWIKMNQVNFGRHMSGQLPAASRGTFLSPIDRVFYESFCVPQDLERILTGLEQSSAELKLAAVAVEMEKYFLKHGHYPETLQGLAPFPDPYSPNGQWCYLPLSGNRLRPVIYSIGPDRVDGGGVPEPQKKKQGDIVWQYTPVPVTQ